MYVKSVKVYLEVVIEVFFKYRSYDFLTFSLIFFLKSVSSSSHYVELKGAKSVLILLIFSLYKTY